MSTLFALAACGSSGSSSVGTAAIKSATATTAAAATTSPATTTAGVTTAAPDAGLIAHAGTAVKGQDFIAVNQSVNWAAGDAAPKTVSLETLNHGAFSGTLQTGNPAAGTLGLAAASYSAAYRANSVLLGVARTAGSSGAVSVSYSTQNGTAVSGTDYTSTSGELSWANGDSSVKTVTIPLHSTAAYAGTRSLTFILSNPTAASLNTPSSAAISLTGACPGDTGCVSGPMVHITSSFVFAHPGTLNTAYELSKIKNHITNGDQPWSANYSMMEASQYCSSSYSDHPVATVVYNANNPNSGPGPNLVADSEAAYCLALRFVLSGTTSYATKAETILADWARTICTPMGSPAACTVQGWLGLSWYLDPAWSGQMFAEAADLLKAYDSSWPASSQSAVATMFNNVWLPILHKRYSFGNREFAVEAGMISIAVFLEDPAALYEAVQNNLSYVPSYVYDAAIDGATPQQPTYFSTWASDTYLATLNSSRLCSGCTNWLTLSVPYQTGGSGDQGDDHTIMTIQTVAEQWQNPPNCGPQNPPACIWSGTYVSGWSPEVGGRDMTHAEGGFSAAVNIAEIARNQGLNLYFDTAPRLALYSEALAYIRLGNPIPSDAYGGVLNEGSGITPTWEIMANEGINVLGLSMPYTSSLITGVIRNMTNISYAAPFSSPFLTSPPLFAALIYYQATYGINWETLTHARLDGSLP
jgi:hypothetical protein